MNRGGVDMVDAAELRRRLDREDVLLLDVRRAEDAAADPVRIPGAAWRDPAGTASWSGELPKGKPVALYCVRGGSVSGGVAGALADAGHEVLRLEGGLAAWRSAGGELEPV